MSARLDCLVIGHNDPPFDEYEAWMRRTYGVDSEAYRDLRFNFMDVGGRKRTYVDLLNDATGSSGAAPYLSGDIPHLAAVYLTQFLRRSGLTAEYVSLFQSEKGRLEDLLTSTPPTCVAITTTLYVTNGPATEIIEWVRRLSPRTRVIIGGPLVANHDRNGSAGAFEAAVRDLGADYCIIDSQGEATLARLVTALRDGQDPADLPNLAYISDGSLVRTPRVPEDNSVEANAIDWRSAVHPADARTLQTRTARSCAFACAFCNYPTRAGKLVTMGVDTVAAELETMRALGSVQNVIFIDDTFNVPTRRFKDLCRMMIRERFDFSWFSYFRCSNADDEDIALMAESGCRGVFLGIESGAPAVLKNMTKHAAVDKYEWAIERLHAAGILTFASFIIGFPGETSATVAETAAFIRRTRPTFYRAQLWYNEPGTPVREHAAQYGIEGDGFVWRHATMDSLEAMDEIDRLFLSVDESIWLPQWSFDFWILPYLMGRGLTRRQIETVLRHADGLLRLEVAGITGTRKDAIQRIALQQIRECLRPVAAAPYGHTAAL